MVPPKDHKRNIEHEVSVAVRITPGSLDMANNPSPDDAENTAKENQFLAEMTISIWPMRKDRYFSLTFTSRLAGGIAFSRTHSREFTQNSTESELSQSVPPAPSSQMASYICPSCGSVYTHAETSSTALHSHDSPRSSLGGAPAVKPPLTNVEKLLRMQNSLIDAMEVPIIAMWKDESVATFNKALSRLMYQDPGEAHSTDPFEILSSFKAYTEDFQRELTPDEYPIVKGCRSQQPQPMCKVGVIDSNARPRLFEFAVDRILDDETGDFQAVLVVMKDVTWYTEQIKAQGEQSEKQFQLICETLPQMVSVSRFLVNKKSIANSVLRLRSGQLFPMVPLV